MKNKIRFIIVISSMKIALIRMRIKLFKKINGEF